MVIMLLIMVHNHDVSCSSQVQSEHIIYILMFVDDADVSHCPPPGGMHEGDGVDGMRAWTVTPSRCVSNQCWFLQHHAVDIYTRQSYWLPGAACVALQVIHDTVEVLVHLLLQPVVVGGEQPAVSAMPSMPAASC